MANILLIGEFVTKPNKWWKGFCGFHKKLKDLANILHCHLGKKWGHRYFKMPHSLRDWSDNITGGGGFWGGVPRLRHLSEGGTQILPIIRWWVPIFCQSSDGGCPDSVNPQMAVPRLYQSSDGRCPDSANPQMAEHPDSANPQIAEHPDFCDENRKAFTP